MTKIAGFQAPRVGHHREVVSKRTDVAVPCTIAKLGRANVVALLTACVACVCIVVVGEFDAAGSLASDRPGVRAIPASAIALSDASASFVRPRSLPDPDPKADTLRAHASRNGLYFGTMIDGPPLNNDGWETAWVRNTLGSEFNMMVPGNPLRWWVSHPAPDRFDFEPGDELIDFAVAHNMKVRGQFLLWGMANPDWLGNGPASTYTKFTGEELEAILVNHIRTVMGHYRDKYPGVIKWWDVTNETMGWNHQFNSDGILWTKIGTNPDRADYLRVAFRTARATDPDAILCMNEHGTEGSVPDRTQNMIDAVRRFKAEGIPIDCVGIQTHLPSETSQLRHPPTYDEVLKVMKTYADMGVQVQVTEFDIQSPRSAPDWNKASKIAADVLKACIDSPNCTAFTNWGFSQAYLLNSGGDPKTVTMLPWDEKNQKSPIYSAMRNVLKGGVH
jgi:endo-1,4-beta-xylanase